MSENSMYLMMIVLILGLAYIVGVALFALVIAWGKGYCHRFYEMSDPKL
jgi:hypothetical protein